MPCPLPEGVLGPEAEVKYRRQAEVWLGRSAHCRELWGPAGRTWLILGFGSDGRIEP